MLKRCATLPNALMSASSTEDENLTGCTPALRRRRQSDKYVTDVSQLNLRFARPQQRQTVAPPRGVPSHLLGEFPPKKPQDESSDNESEGLAPPPPPATLPPHAAENNARLLFPTKCLLFCFHSALLSKKNRNCIC